MRAKGVKIKWGKYFHVYNISLFASLMPSCEDSEIRLCSDDCGGSLLRTVLMFSNPMYRICGENGMHAFLENIKK